MEDVRSMSNYEIIDLDLVRETMSVAWPDPIHANFTMPRLGGAWVSGPDLDRYIAAQHPTNRRIDPQTLSESERTIWMETQAWAQTLRSEPRPLSDPDHLIDLVAAYRQSRFLEMTARADPLDGAALVFTGTGTHSWTVPRTVSWIRLAIFSSGQADHEQGPGMMWARGCQVEPGDTVIMNIGTETTVSSSLGQVTVGSGWSAPGQVPREAYKVLPWGHSGRAGAVIIY